MNYTRPIVFSAASIRGVEHILKGGTLASRIKVRAALDTAAAQQLGARFAFDGKAFPREGYKTVELEEELQTVKAHFIPGNGMQQHQLSVDADKAGKFKLMRQKAAKSGGVSKIVLQFVIYVSANPFDLLEYLLKMNSAECKLELISRQGELFEKKPQDAAVVEPLRRKRGRPPKVHPQPTIVDAKDPDRKRTAANDPVN